MGKVKLFFSNGGLKWLISLGIQVATFLCLSSYVIGQKQMRTEYTISDLDKLEKLVCTLNDSVSNMKNDLTDLRSKVSFLYEIVVRDIRSRNN